MPVRRRASRVAAAAVPPLSLRVCAALCSRGAAPRRPQNTKKLTLSAVCETKLEEQTFGCRLEQALTARVSEIPKAIETQFGLTTCNIRNPVQCKMGPSLEECAKCGDEKIGADTVRMCLDGEDD